jgi:excisionase family DNA binding protein
VSHPTLPLWSVRDVAEFLNVRVLRVYELVHARQIPFLKVGPRQLRFDPLVIRQWLDARSTQVLTQATEER